MSDNRTASERTGPAEDSKVVMVLGHTLLCLLSISIKQSSAGNDVHADHKHMSHCEMWSNTEGTLQFCAIVTTLAVRDSRNVQSSRSIARSDKLYLLHLRVS